MFGSSQGLSFGAGYASQEAPDATNTPQKRTRTEDNQTCMPLTVRLLSDAAAKADNGTELKVHGADLVNFVLVGVVEGLVKQATGLEFVLNDASGRVKVRHYQSAEEATTDLASGRYVTIVGGLRMTPMLHVSALSIRPVRSADEVSYHMIEVAHAALKLKHGGSRAPEEAFTTPAKLLTSPVAPSDPLTPPKASQEDPPVATPMLGQTPTVSVALTGNALKEAVMAVFRKEGEGNAEGVAVSSVFAHLKATSQETIRGMVTQLVDDGELFSTIDEEHFAPL